MSPREQVYIKAGIIAALTLFFALGLWWFVRADTNLLVNPSFEWDWRQQGAPELYYPDPWRLEYIDVSHPWCPSPCKRPEITQNTEYVYDGSYSVRAFAPAYSRALFALYQEFTGEPGSLWTGRCKVRTESLPEGGLLISVGIQPWAGGLFDAPAIRGKETRVRREWTTVEVTAPIYGSKGKFAVYYRAEWPTQNNTVWIDACELFPASGAPQPTYTPYPTNTPYPTPEPCPTCTPGTGCDYGTIRAIVREELDKTKLGAE